jgi:hypothetical protein
LTLPLATIESPANDLLAWPGGIIMSSYIHEAIARGLHLDADGVKAKGDQR